MKKTGTSNARAYDLYLLGLAQWNRFDQAGYTRAIEFFNEAIKLDPQFAQAHAGLGHAWALLGVDYDRPPHEVMPIAKQAAETALRLDDSVPEAHVARAMYLLFYDWNWSEAEREFQRAMELDRNNTDALHYYGHYLEAVGRTADAVSVSQQAAGLDSLSLIINAELGFAYYCAKRFDEAISTLRATVKMDPNFVYAAWILAQALERIGRYDEALAELERVRTAGWVGIQLEMACAHAGAGRAGQARRILSSLQSQGALLDPSLVAMIHAELGDAAAVIEWLERAYAAKSATVAWINVEPKFEKVRPDPRFQNLLRRLRLVA